MTSTANAKARGGNIVLVLLTLASMPDGTLLMLLTSAVMLTVGLLAASGPRDARSASTPPRPSRTLDDRYWSEVTRRFIGRIRL